MEVSWSIFNTKFKKHTLHYWRLLCLTRLWSTCAPIFAA